MTRSSSPAGSSPAHVPVGIQPHGCLLACDATATTVLRHSTNAGSMLGVDGPLNGRALADLIGTAAVHDLRNATTKATDGARPALLPGFPLANGRAFDVAVHRLDATVIVEFEPADPATSDALQMTREMIGRISEVADADTLIRRTTRLVQAMLGYDRVVVCRFGADGAGRVVGEACRPDLEPLLGQSLSASILPAQARSRPRSAIRVIPDAAGQPVAIEPELDEAGATLDLSLAQLRSVPPAQGEDLRRLGVAASVTMPVVVDGSLWGLIACLHGAPRTLPTGERIAAELFGQFFSLHLAALRPPADEGRQ